MHVERVLMAWNSRSKRGTAAAEEAEAWLASRSIALERVEPGSPEELAHRIERSTADCLMLVGGDGTLHFALPALLGRELPVAVVPAGTANDFARILRIGETVEEACSALLNGAPVAVDVGLVDDEPFLNSAHIGLGADVAAASSSGSKRLLGVLSYLRNALRVVRDPDRFRAEVRCDGEVHRFTSIQMTLGNAPFYGGGNVVHADSTARDGRLYLYSVRPRNLAQLVAIAPLLRYGRGGAELGIDRLEGQRLGVRTDRPREIYADGEAVASTPARFAIRRRAVRFVMGPEPEGEIDDKLLLSSADAALRDVAAQLREAAAHYREVAGALSDAALSERCARLGRRRGEQARSLEAHVHDRGLRPREPDPDRETLGRFITWLRARLAEDETEAITNDCAERDQRTAHALDELREQLGASDADLRDELGALGRELRTDAASLGAP